MRNIKSIAVYCGSNFGDTDAYRIAADELGRNLAANNIRLIYGGTHKGLMGVLADAALEAGGSAHGVITERLKGKGHLHNGLTSFEVVATMRARKALMIEYADAFIALPGGLGTLEEFMEVWTLNQLGELDKPLALFNIAGYYNAFTNFIDHMIKTRFLPAPHRKSIVVEDSASALVEGLKNMEKITTPKWLT
jgi:uncharacterized protein (TIGR00730 family)